MNLFQNNPNAYVPLAERLRPRQLDDFIGQSALIGKDGLVRRLLAQQQMVSMIFWGPPGSGKTTLANIIAETLRAKFVAFSAVTAGVKDLRAVIEQAAKDRDFYGQRTILFIDEIHRWNKSQQDALLPYVEQGIITLIGATTENPSFELNSALLSRCQVMVFEKLSETDIHTLIARAKLPMTEAVVQLITNLADGDGRVALNTIELLQRTQQDLAKITVADVKQAVEKIALRYDKAGEEHYNIISALHKTMRASDVQAALYWCGRMLFAGEDPLYVMRRVVEFASEDIGNADPQALLLCVAAYQTVHALGMPEGQFAVFQAVAYCACAPKSRAVHTAARQVEQDIKQTPNSPVPTHLRNAPTKLMQQLGYGQNQGQSNLPEHLRGREYYKKP